MTDPNTQDSPAPDPPAPLLMNESASSIPFDEQEDTVSVQKGLELLYQQPDTPNAADATRVFSKVPVRSSLRKLTPAFRADPEGSKTETESFRATNAQVLQDGCYLVYDNVSGGTLVLHYSHESVAPENAVGFWAPGKDKQIASWKYTSKAGYSELVRGIVGGEKNKKRYYSGWCQFLQMAKSFKGRVQKFPHFTQGVAVDIYAYQDGKVSLLDMDEPALVDISKIQSVAVVPKGQHAHLFGVHSLTEVAFLEQGNFAGASLQLHE